MDFKFTEEQGKFRKEIRDFLEEELRQGFFQTRCDALREGFSPEFSRKIAQRGWIGLAWPKEYGGKGLSYIDRLIYTEEMLRYGAPAAAHWIGDRQMAPSIIAHGSDELKREFLPKILKAEVVFCIGMSEPNAGSDLASLSTKAVADGDDYVIDGQKVWTSMAHRSDYIYLVTRTDPDAPKHKGISEFIVDLKLPGVTIRPLTDLTGEHYFNEVFFDGVRVPKKYLVGEKNRGWYQIAAQLDYERAGIERLMDNYPLFMALVKYVRKTRRNGKLLAEEPTLRHKLAELQVEFEVGRILCYRVAWVLSQGVLPNYEAAMTKAFCTEFQQRLANTTTLILGLQGQLLSDSKWVPMAGMASSSYLLSRTDTIRGGTSEILRNIVAIRGLGLPPR